MATSQATTSQCQSLTGNQTCIAEPYGWMYNQCMTSIHTAQRLAPQANSSLTLELFMPELACYTSLGEALAICTVLQQQLRRDAQIRWQSMLDQEAFFLLLIPNTWDVMSTLPLL